MIHETKKLDQIGVNSFEQVQNITWVINPKEEISFLALYISYNMINLSHILKRSILVL